MNYKAFRNFLKCKKLKDEWHLAINGETQNQLVSLNSVLVRRKHFEGKKIQLLNTGSAHRDDIDWIEFEYEQKAFLRLEIKQPKQSAADSSDAEAGQVFSYANDFTDLHQIINNLKMHKNDAEQVKQVLIEKEAKLHQLEQKLLERERELDARAKDLEQREQFVANSEEKLIYLSMKQEERSAELEQIVEDLDMGYAASG